VKVEWKVRRLAAVEADSGEKVRKLSEKCESSSDDESCTVSAAAGVVYVFCIVCVCCATLLYRTLYDIDVPPL
jgi:hypothetical protein